MMFVAARTHPELNHYMYLLTDELPWSHPCLKRDSGLERTQCEAPEVTSVS